MLCGLIEAFFGIKAPGGAEFESLQQLYCTFKTP